MTRFACPLILTLVATLTLTPATMAQSNCGSNDAAASAAPTYPCRADDVRVRLDCVLSLLSLDAAQESRVDVALKLLDEQLRLSSERGVIARRSLAEATSAGGSHSAQALAASRTLDTIACERMTAYRTLAVTVDAVLRPEQRELFTPVVDHWKTFSSLCGAPPLPPATGATRKDEPVRSLD
jgi:hypothetical protein